jgi:hypothetical protein
MEYRDENGRDKMGEITIRGFISEWPEKHIEVG